MTRSSRVARLLLAATFVMAAMGAWAAPAAAEEPAPDRSTQQFEIRFMEFTIEHHLMGVEMAELCMEKTTPPPPEGDATLVERCAVIAEDQAQEAQMLQDWLRDWYGVEFEPKMSSGQLNKLIKAEGEEFDIEVAGMFIEHHLRQIKESQKCLERAFHEELLDLCQHMIAEQSADIIVFRDILQQHGEDFRNQVEVARSDPADSHGSARDRPRECVVRRAPQQYPLGRSSHVNVVLALRSFNAWRRA